MFRSCKAIIRFIVRVIIHIICKYTDILYCHFLKLLNFINFVVYVDCVSKNVIQKMNTSFIKLIKYGRAVARK